MKKIFNYIYIFIILLLASFINVNAEKLNGNCNNLSIGLDNVELWKSLEAADSTRFNNLYEEDRYKCNYYEDCFFDDSNANCYFKPVNAYTPSTNSGTLDNPGIQGNQSTGIGAGSGCSIYTPNIQPNLDPADKKRLIEESKQKCNDNGCRWSSSQMVCKDRSSNDDEFQSDIEPSCNNLFGDFTKDINNVISAIGIIAPIIVVAVSVYEYLLAVINKDADALKKCNSRLIKRIVLMVVLFFLPILINLFLELLGNEYGTCL